MSSAPESDNGESGSQTVFEPDSNRLGGMLVRAGIITDRQLKEALAVQERKGGKLADTLIYLGSLDARKFLEFLAKRPGIPSISLRHCRVSDEVIELVPKEFVIQHEIFPIDRLGKLLTVAMVCPLDKATIEELEGVCGLKVKSMLCAANEIHEAIRRYYDRNAFPLEVNTNVRATRR